MSSSRLTFGSTLQTDRMIQIHVGQVGAPPFLVPQSTLSNASEYFVEAFKNEKVGECESGVLRFPEDDFQAWQLLLWWIVKTQLPDEIKLAWEDDKVAEQVVLLLSQAWLLAEKYRLVLFQDVAMIELLRTSEYWPWTLDALKVAFEGTMPGSPLRRLASEEAVHRLLNQEDELEPADLDDLHATGIMGSMMNAVQASATRSGRGNFGTFADRLEHEIWEEFMVGPIL